MKKLLLTFLLFCILGVNHANAQAVVQPKIMVIPYTKEGDDIRTVLENDENKRIVLTKIKEAFDERGFSTIDFVAKLKSIESGNVFNSDNLEDIKSQIIDMAGADIYVEAEIFCNTKSSGESNVKITITSYDSATGTSLSNKVGESGNFYTQDFAKLGMRAIASCADDFLNVMQAKFTDIAENGRSLMIQIGFDENSVYTMESPVGEQGLLLQDEIELWIADNAYNGDYHIQGVSPLKMIFDDVKIPLISENSGRAYTSSKFGMELLRFFRSLNIPISRSSKGNTLFITIQ